MLRFAIKKNKRKQITNHTLVAIAFLNHTPCGHKLVIDHIDGNPLNNMLNNLQIITQRQNVTKKKNKRKPASIYTGVFWSKRGKKWKSRIYINGKYVNLGSYENELDAHNAYQNKLKEIKNEN